MSVSKAFGLGFFPPSHFIGFSLNAKHSVNIINLVLRIGLLNTQDMFAID